MADLNEVTRLPPRQGTVRAILTDVQFWVPALVLVAGVVLLIVLH